MVFFKSPWVIVLCTFIVTLFIIGIVCTLGFHKMHRSKTKILTELSNFVNTSVVPELKPLRAELENSLSSEEKLKIDELRTKAKAIIELQSKLYTKYHSTDKSLELVICDEDIALVKNSQKEVRHIVTECWNILDQHENEFDKIEGEFMPKIELWHADIKKKMGKIAHHHKGHSMRPGLHKAHAQFGGAFMAPVVFILFEPETNFPFNEFQASIEQYLSNRKHHKKYCSEK